MKEKLENSHSQIISIHESYEERLKKLIEEKNAEINNLNKLNFVIKKYVKNEF